MPLPYRLDVTVIIFSDVFRYATFPILLFPLF
jgi:hypothetical protein